MSDIDGIDAELIKLPTGDGQEATTGATKTDGVMIYDKVENVEAKIGQRRDHKVDVLGVQCTHIVNSLRQDLSHQRQDGPGCSVVFRRAPRC